MQSRGSKIGRPRVPKGAKNGGGRGGGGDTLSSAAEATGMDEEMQMQKALAASMEYTATFANTAAATAAPAVVAASGSEAPAADTDNVPPVADVE